MDNYYIMTRIIEELSIRGIPVVFKGAMTLKHLLEINGVSMIRMTQDIDMNWVGKPISMDELFNIVYTVVKLVDSSLNVEIKRNFSDTKSAGFKIYNSNSSIKFSMDISMRQTKEVFTYRTSINNIMFNGSGINKILADKMNSISTNKIFRRVKDVVDLYQLSMIQGFEFNKAMELTDGKLSDFNAFLNRLDELEYAYNKLHTACEKLPFYEIYNRVKLFAEPFITVKSSNIQLVWNGCCWI